MKYFITLLIFLFNLTLYGQEDYDVYYQCDYEKENYYTILSSGTQNVINEVWGVDKSIYDNLREIDLNNVDLNEIIKKAECHLTTRFQTSELNLVAIRYEKINPQDINNSKNWFIILTFQYDEKGYVQKVPSLLDGRIILSDAE